MTRRGNRLILIALAVCAATFYFSCTQPNDILTPVTKTDMYLTAQNLPTNPNGMIYELWVANDQDTVSLGKFGYNQMWLTYHLENGDEKLDSNHFVLDGDIFEYSDIFVSVETDPDDLPGVPGPVMLIDDVTEPSNNPIELRFPFSDSLWNATAIFNMETPSDSDRTTGGGYGVWFSAYYWSQDSVRDTVSLDSFKLVTKPDSSLPHDTFTTYLVDTINVRVLDTTRVFGLDTTRDTIVRFDSVLDTSDTWPYVVMDDGAGKTIFYYSFSPDTPGVADTFHYDNFVQFDFGLLDYSAYGWKYKGWVVSPQVPVSVVGQITPPAYAINYNQYDSLIPGIKGGLLTVGTFNDIAAPDDSNPYCIGPRVPPIPGEDFLTDLPPGLEGWQGLVPDEDDNSGTVFITLEPVNFVTDTTNFPLFVLIGKIPVTRDSVFGTAIADVQSFDMYNETPTNRPTEVFPKIEVDIERF